VGDRAYLAEAGGDVLHGPPAAGEHCEPWMAGEFPGDRFELYCDLC
jgi:hypothetical protein